MGPVFDYSLARSDLTSEGAQVVLLAERKRVDAWVDGLFDAPADLGELPGSRDLSQPLGPVKPRPTWGLALIRK